MGLALEHVEPAGRVDLQKLDVTERFRTTDNMIAFNKSVNLVVNLRDISLFGMVLRSAIADHTEFYRVYRESLVKTGRV